MIQVQARAALEAVTQIQQALPEGALWDLSQVAIDNLTGLVEGRNRRRHSWVRAEDDSEGRRQWRCLTCKIVLRNGVRPLPLCVLQERKGAVPR
jgi:hypothetical protein